MRTSHDVASVADEGVRRPRPATTGALGIAHSSDAEPLDPIVELVHDLRSPLSSVLLLSHELMQAADGQLSESRRRQLALMHGAALALTTLLADALESSSIDDSFVETESFSLGEVLETVAATLGPLAEMRGLTLRTICPTGDRWSGHRPTMSRCLLNLATNALKYTEQGYVEMSVTRLADTTGLLVSVRDTGRGLPRTVAEGWEDPPGPTRGSEETPGRAGTLGLGICRNLVRSMGSELEFETTPGEGTHFHFTLTHPVPAEAVHRR